MLRLLLPAVSPLTISDWPFTLKDNLNIFSSSSETLSSLLPTFPFFIIIFFLFQNNTVESLFCMVSFNCTGNLTQRSNVVNGKYEHSIQYYTTSEVVLVMTGMLCRNVVSIITTFTLQLTSATNKGVTLQRFTALSL